MENSEYFASSCGADALAHQRDANFAKLPLDVLIHILSYLPLTVIIRLRQTCKLLLETTFQRVVWLEALRRICAPNHIFLPTYPLEAMGIFGLIKAAFTPAKFLSFPHKADMLAELARTRSFQLKGLPANLSEDQLHLVPGGRFLIFQQKNKIEIWNLGYPTDQSIFHPILLCSTAIDRRYRHHPSTTCCPQMVKVFESLQFSIKYAVFEVYPTTSKPRFVEVANLRVLLYPPDNLTCLCIHVWDFSLNLQASWLVDFMPSFIFMTEEQIILLTYTQPRKMGFWKIPTLKSINDDYDLSTIGADFWRPIPDSHSDTFYFYGVMDHWYQNGGIASGFNPYAFMVGQVHDICASQSLRICNHTILATCILSVGVMFTAKLDPSMMHHYARVGIELPLGTPQVAALCTASRRSCYLSEGDPDGNIHVAECNVISLVPSSSFTFTAKLHPSTQS